VGRSLGIALPTSPVDSNARYLRHRELELHKVAPNALCRMQRHCAAMLQTKQRITQPLRSRIASGGGEE
jgi:hypothetical protein